MGYYATIPTAYIEVDGIDDRRIWRSTVDGNGIGMCTDAAHEISGKCYFEIEAIAVDGTPSAYNGSVGICRDTHNLLVYIGSPGNTDGWGYHNYGNFCDGTTTASGTTWGIGDVIMIAVDKTAGKVWFGKNGTWLVSGDPENGTNPALTDADITNNSVYMASSLWAKYSGQYLHPTASTQVYDPPTGFDPVVIEVATSNDLDGELPELSGDFVSGINYDGHWPLDEIDEEGETRDIVGTNHATVNEMTVATGGVVESYFEGAFVGGSDILNVAFSPPVTDIGSFSFHFKPYSGNNVLFKGENTAGNDCRITFDVGGYINFHVDPSSNTYLSNTFTLGVWHHICVVKEGYTNSRIYVDGNDEGVVPHQVKQIDYLGYPSTYTSSYVPDLDDFRFSNDRWTAEQVNTVANITTPDYSDNYLEATLPLITGSFDSEGQENIVEPVSTSVVGVLSEITGNFTINNRTSILNGKLSTVTGTFSTGLNIDGILPKVTGNFIARVGVSANFDGVLGVVYGNFLTGSSFQGTLPRITADFNTSIEKKLILSGHIPIITGSFNTRVSINSIFDGLLRCVDGHFESTTHLLCNLSSSLHPINGEFNGSTGISGDIHGKLYKINGNFACTNRYTELQGDFYPVEGKFNITNEFDHGLWVYIRGQSR